MCCTEKIKKAIACFSIFGLLLMAACYQQFERLTVKATGEGIIFTHPKMDEAARQGNLCDFGEISVSRKADNYSEQMWTAYSTEQNLKTPAEAMKKCRIVYGEPLPGTSVTIDPKPLREGTYDITGVVIIYNQKREVLRDLSFSDSFVLKKDEAGNLTVSQSAEK